MKRTGAGRTDLDGNKAKTWAAGTQGVVSDNSSRAAPRVSCFFFPLLDHSFACLRERFSSPLSGVITRLRGSRGRPCLPSMVSELSPWESCVRATGRRARPGLGVPFRHDTSRVTSGNELITSERSFILRVLHQKEGEKKLGGHEEGYLKHLAGHADCFEAKYWLIIHLILMMGLTWFRKSQS